MIARDSFMAASKSANALTDAIPNAPTAAVTAPSAIAEFLANPVSAAEASLTPLSSNRLTIGNRIGPPAITVPTF